MHQVQQGGGYYGGRASDFRDDDPLPTPAPLPPTEPDPDMREDGPLSLMARVEYSALPKGEIQSVFGLVTLQAGVTADPYMTAAELRREERQPLDLVCVLDVSASMSGPKLDEVKRAVRFIIDESQPNDRVSIVTFCHQAKRCLRLCRMDRGGKEEASGATNRLRSDRGTLIAPGLLMALDVVEQRRQRNKVCAILLLTDGQDHSCAQYLDEIVRRAKAANCSIYAFGFGADHDAGLLGTVAEKVQTPYTYVETTDTIREAFAGVVGGLSSIVAQGIELSLDSRVVLKEVNTGFEVRREGDKKAVIAIPDIFAGERRDVLVELLLPSSENDGSTLLLEASVKYSDIRHGAAVLICSRPTSMSVLRVDEPQPELEPDEEVVDQKERVEVTRTLEAASERCNQGHFQEARTLLQQTVSRVSKRSSHFSEALTRDLHDAQDRMRDQRVWTHSGRAEVEDTRQMHKVQRCTNTTVSASSRIDKVSKSMYSTPAQSVMISRSSAARSSQK